MYTTGNDHGDEMFKAAAETRKKNIEGGKGFNPEKDIVLMLAVSDMGELKNQIEGAIEKNSEKFGETQEVGIWSHAGLDGPIGTTPASQGGLFEGSTQLSQDAWGSIDYNWKGDGNGTSLSFYGCNTGKGGEESFANKVSGMGNSENVSVSGQTTSAYPSFYTNKRVTSMGRNLNMNDRAGRNAFSIGGGTYMVGGNKGEGSKATFPSIINNYPSANPMQVNKNSAITKTIYQPGTKY